MAKLNGVTLLSPDGTRSDVTLMPMNVWERMGRAKFKKSNLQLKHFDGLIIKILGSYAWDN